MYEYIINRLDFKYITQEYTTEIEKYEKQQNKDDRNYLNQLKSKKKTEMPNVMCTYFKTFKMTIQFTKTMIIILTWTISTTMTYT